LKPTTVQLATRMPRNNQNQNGMLGTLRSYVGEFDPTYGTSKSNELKTPMNMAKTWNDWVTNLETCLELENVPLNSWRKVLTVLGGQELRNKINSLSNADETYQQVKAKLNALFKDNRNLNGLRHQLFNMKQRDGESTRTWMERCKELADQCQLEEFSVKDALLLNLVQFTELEKLRQEIIVKDLKYDEAVKFAATLEMAEKEATIFKKEENEIDRVKKAGNYSMRKRRQEEMTNSGDTENNKRCGRCGKPWHQNLSECRALKATCNKCKKTGHFAHKCRTKIVAPIENTVDGNNTLEEDGNELSF